MWNIIVPYSNIPVPRESKEKNRILYPTFAITSPMLTDFQNYFIIGLGSKCVMIVIKDPTSDPHLKCFATLPCET